MNKLLTKIVGVGLGLTMAIGVGVAVSANNNEVMPVHAAADGTYSIVFKDNGTPSDGNSDQGETPTVSNIVAATSQAYVNSFSGCSKLYLGKTGYGIKLGSSSAAGTVNFTLKPSYQANVVAIKVISAIYGSDTGKLSLYSGSTSLETGKTVGTDFTHTFATATTVESIKVSTSSKRAYIKQIDITISNPGGGGGGGDELAGETGTINFGSATNSTPINAASGSGTDSLGQSWSYSVEWGTATPSYTQNASYSQIGASGKLCTSVTLTTTLPSNYKVEAFSVKTGGFSGTSGTATLKVGSTPVGTGSISSSDVVIPATTLTEVGTLLTVVLQGNSTMRFKLYFISYSLASSNELSSVTTSGQTTSFTAGNTFSYDGTLTAHYTVDDDATVTPTSFKFGASGINPTTAGTAITTSTTLTKAEHDGKYIYVIYTEDDITKYCSYQITVNYAAVTSVVIDTHAAEIGLNETYDYNLVGVTVNPSNADQGYEWVVHSNTVGNDYTFDGSGLKSKDTEGTITLRCRSTADNSKYDELVVTVTGDPVVDIIPASVSGYVGKSIDVDFTYGNIDNEELIDFASSDESVLTVGDHIEDSGEGAVTINFVGAGSATLSVSYNGGSTLDSITVTVSADSVTALSWSAPTIKVYSGATTTVSDASSWNVHYTMASGVEDDLSYGEYTLKLGGSLIALPHTWDASEDGKVLSIEYGGFASPTTSTVDVTQSLRPVIAPVAGEESTKTWTATAAANFGSTIKNVNDTASGSVTFNNGSTMSYERTLEFVASGKADYLAFSSNYIQFGSSNALEKLVLTAATSGTVTSVVVDCWAKDGGSNISVTVGGNAFDSSKKCPSAGAEVTFNGSATGTVVITMEKSTKTAGLAQYIKSVAITTVEESGETTNIANVAGHEAAQKAVVAFAKAMNAAFDNTANCTDGVAAAWATASSAYSSNITNNASLSADEKAYAKNLIKYASAQYTEHTDNDYSYCLERAMATYEKCVLDHGQTAFLSEIRPLSNANSANSLLGMLNIDNSAAITLVTVISVLSMTTLGAYFLLRKRKEEE